MSYVRHDDINLITLKNLLPNSEQREKLLAISFRQVANYFHGRGCCKMIGAIPYASVLKCYEFPSAQESDIGKNLCFKIGTVFFCFCCCYVILLLFWGTIENLRVEKEIAFCHYTVYLL